ncbi:hypothetical protein LCGC14_2183510 [marine sediment metagenome]|uniref:Uncharacterized protein n=1 Tax=marine sediment metagenome TaxID=412755 RepID=A0A0F9DLK8_9ZZZZ
MNKQKRLDNICRNFQRKMQKIVDESDGITGVSIEVGGEKHIIAEKKKDKKDE